MTTTQDALDTLTKAVDYRKRLIFGNFPASPHVLIGLDEADVIIAALTRLAELENVAEEMADACQDILDRNEIQHWFNTDKQRDALAAYSKVKGEKE